MAATRREKHAAKDSGSARIGTGRRHNLTSAPVTGIREHPGLVLWGFSLSLSQSLTLSTGSLGFNVPLENSACHFFFFRNSPPEEQHNRSGSPALSHERRRSKGARERARESLWIGNKASEARCPSESKTISSCLFGWGFFFSLFILLSCLSGPRSHAAHSEVKLLQRGGINK